LVREFNIKVHKKGPECIFSPKGKLALMFLKNYAGVSDYKLIEQLNGNMKVVSNILRMSSFFMILCNGYMNK